MIKIGVFTGEEEVDRLHAAIKTQENIEIIENIFFDSTLSEPDAMFITYKDQQSFELIQKCIKSFKHVYISRSEKLPYEDFQQLVKIGEESRVHIYPDFSSQTCYLKENIDKKLTSDVHYISLKQNISGELLQEDLKSLLLKNIDIALSFTKANVKKVTTNTWPFGDSVSGTIYVHFDFDNGNMASILIHSHFQTGEQRIELFSQTESVRITMNDVSLKSSILNTESPVIQYSTVSISENTGFTSNINSFIKTLNGVFFGFVDIDNKFNAIRLCDLVCAKLKCNCPLIII